MENTRYGINKYYTLEEIDMVIKESNTQALVEKFMVVRITKKIAGHQYVYQEVLSDGFNSYKEALDYIDDMLGLPVIKK